MWLSFGVFYVHKSDRKFTFFLRISRISWSHSMLHDDKKRSVHSPHSKKASHYCGCCAVESLTVQQLIDWVSDNILFMMSFPSHQTIRCPKVNDDDDDDDFFCNFITILCSQRREWERKWVKEHWGTGNNSFVA